MQSMAARCNKCCGHQRQGCIFGAADCNTTVKGVSSFNNYFVHYYLSFFLACSTRGRPDQSASTATSLIHLPVCL